MTDQAPASARLAFYALPAIPMAAIALPFYIVLPTFYADHFAMSLATIGAVLLGIRLIDAVTDPLMGALADRTRSRCGRFKPYLLYGALPMAFAGVLTWTDPNDTFGVSLFGAYQERTSESVSATSNAWNVSPPNAAGSATA